MWLSLLHTWVVTTSITAKTFPYKYFSYANWSWFTVFHCFVQHSMHFKINWIFIYKYKLISFIAVCFIFTVSISYCYFSGMIEKAGQDNNRNQKDSTNRKSVVVVDDDPSAQQKTGCCWHCCHSDANFFSSRKKRTSKLLQVLMEGSN